MKMKLVLAVMLLALTVCAQSTNRNELELYWPQDSQDRTSHVYYVYATTNVPPVGGWTVYTNIAYRDWTNSGHRVWIPLAETSARFFVITRSNLFGESPFTIPVESVRSTAGTGVVIRARTRANP